MPARFCLDCGVLQRTGGSRCAACQEALRLRQNARPKGNTTQRGLGADHRRRARELDLANPATVCARCGLPGTAEDPLTAGHVIARSQGGGDGPLQPEHRSCNSRAGAELRRRAP